MSAINGTRARQSKKRKKMKNYGMSSQFGRGESNPGLQLGILCNEIRTCKYSPTNNNHTRLPCTVYHTPSLSKGKRQSFSEGKDPARDFRRKKKHAFFFLRKSPAGSFPLEKPCLFPPDKLREKFFARFPTETDFDRRHLTMRKNLEEGRREYKKPKGNVLRRDDPIRVRGVEPRSAVDNWEAEDDKWLSCTMRHTRAKVGWFKKEKSRKKPYGNRIRMRGVEPRSATWTHRQFKDGVAVHHAPHPG
ncbi:hypothetical protein C8R43DRAFT_949837 [Mycena crocata]|nr:hypothetical protein C8R43DRAFT_949837 [Mycena crocata]